MLPMADGDENQSSAEMQPEAVPASETPDPVVPVETVEPVTEPEPIEAGGDDVPAAAATPADGTSEQPDGQVEEPLDDGEPAAVDPHIDMGLLEAYLFSTHSPLTAGKLAELFELESTKPVRKALRVLNEQYMQSQRCFRVEQVAGGFQLLTLPDYGDKLKALHQREQDAKLTKAALETLAIIAFKQPILRADIEAIRGVASGETIRSLMEKHLVKISGRAEEPGRPILYGTTKRFLEVFGLNSLRDLPQPEALQAKAQQMAQVAQSLLVEDAPAAETTPGETEAVPNAEPVPPSDAVPPEAAAEPSSVVATDQPAQDAPAQPETPAATEPARDSETGSAAD